METQRIIKVYEERDRYEKGRELYFGYEDLSHFTRLQSRYRATFSVLKSNGFNPLTQRRILDVGCGDGRMLRQFLQWGAQPRNLAGIDLRRDPVDYALTINPNVDIRCDSATEMPWGDRSFDLVFQNTVFSSILDADTRKQVASEMLRVLKPGGSIVWYDFWLNPSNKQTRGIRPKEIRELFPGCRFEFHKITLAPPIGRFLVPISCGLATLLEGLRILNTHYLVMISPPNQAAKDMR